MTTATKTEKMVVIDIGHQVVKDTEKGICLKVNGKDTWFAKQKVKFSLEKGKLQLPYWIALKSGCLENSSAPVETPINSPIQPIQPAPVKSAASAVSPIMGNLQVLEELAKLTAEARVISHRLAEIQRLITQATQSGGFNHGKY